MFKKTFLGDYDWEITPNISIHFVDDNYKGITSNEATTTVVIDAVSYPLRGDLRAAFENTQGDLSKIKDVYLANIKRSTYVVPKGRDYAPLIRIFVTHINQYIK